MDKEVRQIIVVIVFIAITFLGIGFGMYWFNRAEDVVVLAVDSQGMFEEMYQSIEKQKGTVRDYKELNDSDPNPMNKQVYVAAKNKYRSLVSDYNAKARSIKREFFRSSDLPYSIDPELL